MSNDIVGLKSLTSTSNLMCCIGQHNTRTYCCEVFVNFLGDLISSCYKTQECTLKIFESAETACTCTCKKVVTPTLTLYISIQQIKTKQRPVIMENITLSSLRVKHHSRYTKKIDQLKGSWRFISKKSMPTLPSYFDNPASVNNDIEII